MINTRIMSSYNYFSVSWLLFTPLEHQMGSSRSVGTDFNMSPGFGRMKKDDLQIMRCACRALSPACKELHSCVSLFLSISHLVCPGVGGEGERHWSLPPTSSHCLSSPPNRENKKTHPGLCPVRIDSIIDCSFRPLKTTGIRGFSLLHIMSVILSLI